jgi:Flp pilus assembly protein TadG
MVELALVIPVLLIIVLGVIDFGRAIIAYNQVSNAARAATRTGIVNQDLDTTYSPPIYQFEVAAAKQATGIVVDPVADVTSSFIGTDCPMVGDDCRLQVTVEHHYDALTPIIGLIVGPITVAGTSELPLERNCPPLFTGETVCPLPYGG